MYSKPAMTCLNIRCICMGSEAILYLNAILSVYRTIRTSTMSHQTAPTPTTGSPSPSLYGSKTFTHLEEHSSMVKLPYLWSKTKSKRKPLWLRNHHM